MSFDDTSAWADFVAEIEGLAASDLIVRTEGSTLTVHHPTLSEFVRLEDFGDRMVQISAGWFLSVSAEYADSPGLPSHAAQVVHAIIDGSAEECAHLDAAGHLVGVSWVVRYEGGELSGRRGLTDETTHAHSRSLPAWR